MNSSGNATSWKSVDGANCVASTQSSIGFEPSTATRMRWITERYYKINVENSKKIAKKKFKKIKNMILIASFDAKSSLSIVPNVEWDREVSPNDLVLVEVIRLLKKDGFEVGYSNSIDFNSTLEGYSTNCHWVLNIKW